MFNEVVLKINLGCRLLPGHLVVGRFGFSKAQSIVAVSQSLDKLVVFDTAPSSNSFSTHIADFGRDKGAGSLVALGNQDESQNSSDTANSPVYYITVKDVIRAISVQSIRVLMPVKAAREFVAHENIDYEHPEEGADGSSKSWPSDIAFKDLLLIGCSGSMLIYDSVKGSNLFTLSLPTSIHAIGSSICYSQVVPKETSSDILIDVGESSAAHKDQKNFHQLSICGGPQGLYILRFELDSNEIRRFGAELSSGRSTGDSICCLCHGSFEDMELVITGCVEQKIRIYQLDLLEQNIRACKLTIEESASINCLCSIKTERKLNSPETIKQADNLSLEQMNYFSYGLENGFIGVYRLIGEKTLNSDTVLIGERLWRQRCKFVPFSMLMYDIDGDGLDELLIGFKNGRIEARSPFTGQLLATTRCFKPTEKLVGLSLLDYHMDGRLTLLACSTSGHLFGFRPSFSKPHVALKGFNLPASSQMRSVEAKQPLDQMVAFQLSNSVNMNTINEEQESYLMTRDVFTKAWLTKDELHMQNSLDSSDQLSTRACEAKQSFELMQKIIALQNEQLSLEKKACRIYYDRIHEISKCHPSDLRIVHKWDFDQTRVCLTLTIVITSSLEDLKLIKIKDDNRNFLNTGCLVIKKGDNDALNLNCERRSYVIVVPLRSIRDIETQLELEIFCQLKKKDCRRSNITSRVHYLNIYVPKFSMFSLIDDTTSINQASAASGNAQEDDQRAASGEAGADIRVSCSLRDETQLNKILHWICKNFLCFQFKELIELNTRGVSHTTLNDDNVLMKIVGSNAIVKEFNLQMIDLKHTIRRIFFANNPESVHNSYSYCEISEGLFSSSASLLRISLSDSCFTLECTNSELAVDIVQGLLIDQLHFNLESKEPSELTDFTTYLQPLEDELAEAMKNLRDLEESEKRIQTELYESSDYTRTLIQQLAIANDLNEFEIAKDLLNELSVMLSEAHNSARVHCLNSSRHRLLKRVKELEDRINFLSYRMTK